MARLRTGERSAIVGAVSHAPQPRGDRIEIRIDVDRTSETIAGLVRAPGGGEEFHGWIELIRAIEGACGIQADAGSRRRAIDRGRDG